MTIPAPIDSNRSRLLGCAAIVTGVGQGLGEAIVKALADEGARVLGCDVNEAEGRATMEGIGEFRLTDVSSEAEVEALVADAVEQFGSLDLMVNNAAVQTEVELVETTEEQLDWILGVNLKGAFFGCKHAVLAMRSSGGGAIVNIASILGLVADGLLPAYCAAKGGMLGLTRATAVQYGADGIRCNAICPGDIDTPSLVEYFESASDPVARRAEVEREYPLRRIARPEEIARAVVFLATEDSSFMTGQPLIVDGGLLADCY